jgi:hypothetical protein
LQCLYAFGTYTKINEHLHFDSKLICRGKQTDTDLPLKRGPIETFGFISAHHIKVVKLRTDEKLFSKDNLFNFWARGDWMEEVFL